MSADPASLTLILSSVLIASLFQPHENVAPGMAWLDYVEEATAIICVKELSQIIEAHGSL
jgi:hypothetical protein